MNDKNDDKKHTSLDRNDSSQAHHNPYITRQIKLLKRLTADELHKIERGQVLEYPFFVGEKLIRDLSDEAITALKDLNAAVSTEFQGSVRFQDNSSQRFDSFDDFISRAGKRKDPESIIILWSCYAVTDDGDVINGSIKIGFFTNKPLVTRRYNLNLIDESKIKIDVSGSNLRWVDQTFEDIIPYLETTKHGGIMRPLWIFRNRSFVHGISFALGWIAFIAISNYLHEVTTKDVKIDKVNLIAEIKNSKLIEDKFDKYITWVLTPDNTSIAQEILRFLIPMGSLFIVYYVCNKFLPFLTPNSAIAIGVANYRAEAAIDIFKFIVFSVLIGGIIIPGIYDIIKLLF